MNLARGVCVCGSVWGFGGVASNSGRGGGANVWLLLCEGDSRRRCEVVLAGGAAKDGALPAPQKVRGVDRESRREKDDERPPKRAERGALDRARDPERGGGGGGGGDADEREVAEVAAPDGDAVEREDDGAEEERDEARGANPGEGVDDALGAREEARRERERRHRERADSDSDARGEADERAREGARALRLAAREQRLRCDAQRVADVRKEPKALESHLVCCGGSRPEGDKDVVAHGAVARHLEHVAHDERSAHLKEGLERAHRRHAAVAQRHHPRALSRVLPAAPQRAQKESRTDVLRNSSGERRPRDAPTRVEDEVDVADEVDDARESDDAHRRDSVLEPEARALAHVHHHHRRASERADAQVRERVRHERFVDAERAEQRGRGRLEEEARGDAAQPREKECVAEHRGRLRPTPLRLVLGVRLLGRGEASPDEGGGGHREEGEHLEHKVEDGGVGPERGEAEERRLPDARRVHEAHQRVAQHHAQSRDGERRNVAHAPRD
mmetsp:Transcript_25610/g.84306  ORF Transcript_25610/g.84306 Transcript_25610/m.84306 type:complete len:503 (-) Transcript_25610:79-1587(-)